VALVEVNDRAKPGDADLRQWRRVPPSQMTVPVTLVFDFFSSWSGDDSRTRYWSGTHVRDNRGVLRSLQRTWLSGFWFEQVYYSWPWSKNSLKRGHRVRREVYESASFYKGKAAYGSIAWNMVVDEKVVVGKTSRPSSFHHFPRRQTLNYLRASGLEKWGSFSTSAHRRSILRDVTFEPGQVSTAVGAKLAQ
jgi:hypothetical protein